MSSKTYSIIPAGLLALLISGCASSGPTYRPAAIEPPADWQTDVRTDADTPTTWWMVFSDPHLDGLIVDVDLQNRDLAAAVARLDALASAYRIARADWAPMLTAQGGISRERETERVRNPTQTAIPGNPGSLHQGGLLLGWELDVWGRIRHEYQAARGDWQAGREDRRHLSVMLQAQVAQQYTLLRTLQQRLVFARDNIALQTETLQIVKDRFAAGLIGELDERQAELNLATTQAQVPLLESQITATLNTLCLLTGRFPGELDHLRQDAPIPVADRIPSVLPAALIQQRPDIRSAERQVAAQIARVSATRADQLPRFSLDGSVFLAASEMNEWTDSAALKYGIGPTVRWSFFTAGKLRNRTAAEEAAANAAWARYDQAILSAFRECEDALSAHHFESIRLNHLQAAVTAAKHSAEQAHTLYLSGLTDFQVVLDMQRQLAAQQDAMAQSQGQQTLNLITIYKAFGGGWPMDEATAPPPED
jgi:NodT family efflux transporter outer membrane factor (OMF) lipoprotein